MVAATLFTMLFLPIGIIIGWISHIHFLEYFNPEQHQYDELFATNPHPEIYDKEGNIIKNDYMALTFDLGYDPEEFDPEDILEDE